MEHLKWDRRPPSLRKPVLVCSFSGWNDAASSASTAITTLADSLPVERVASIDPEDFFDFQTTRPMISVSDGVHRRIEWPANEILVGRSEAADRDVVLLNGTEPGLKWRTFSETVVEAARELGVESVVVLGALIAEVAHTMPVPITGVASDPELAEGLDLEKANYEGPTGIVGILLDYCRREGLPSLSLWAAVPHYVAGVPNPKAALALSERLERVTGIAADNSGLEEETLDYEEQIGKAVAADPEVQELVSRIEEQQRERTETGGEMPSGDSIAMEFQRFLRQRESE